MNFYSQPDLPSDLLWIHVNKSFASEQHNSDLSDVIEFFAYLLWFLFVWLGCIHYPCIKSQVTETVWTLVKWGCSITDVICLTDEIVLLIDYAAAVYSFRHLVVFLYFLLFTLLLFLSCCIFIFTCAFSVIFVCAFSLCIIMVSRKEVIFFLLFL